VRASWLLVAGVALAGCSQGPRSVAGVCRLNSDCAAPLSCVDGECLPQCREDRDCAGQQVCREQLCVDPDPGKNACARASDCPASQTCIGGICEALVLNTLDAGTGEVPDGGVGPTPDGGPGADAGPDGGVSGLPYGAVCARGSECVSGLCLGPAGGTSGRCTKPCNGNADCTYPDTCTDVPGAGLLCATTQAGGQPGDPCPNGDADCASGICLQASSSRSFCTQPCAPLPTCPSGMTCAPVPDGQGGAVTLCIPGGMGQGFGGGCSRAADCATQLCIGVPSTGQGVCTTYCDQIPCPAGYACTSVDDGQGGAVAVCAPGGAVGGAYGDTCTGAASCQSGLCLNDPRLGGAYCTVPCVSNADCAAISGLVCVRLTSGEQVCALP
jgi:hypothetical protein